MKIERLKIDGFGRFERWEERLAPGLNVFFGPNEAGKSTLLSFVRAVLFGFSRKKAPSRYEPEHGAFGGELLLTTGGGPLWIRRTGSRRRYEGELSLRAPNGERAPPSRLSEAMGGISRQLFFQVFAFGLEEAADFDALAEEGNVAEALFAAGMRGARRLPLALEELRRSSEAIFTPKGRRELNQVLADLEEVQKQLRAIGDRPAQYFEALERLRAIEGDVAVAEATSRRLSTERAGVARLNGATEDLRLLEQLEVELAAFPPLETFPVDATLKLEKLLGHLGRARAEIEQAAAEQKRLQQTLAAVSIPEKLAAAEPVARAALDSFRSRIEQLRALRARAESLALRRAELEESLQPLGAALNPPELLRIDLSAAAREELWAVVREMDGARARIASAQDRQREASAAAERVQRDALPLDAQFAAAPRERFPRWLFPVLWALLLAFAIAVPPVLALPINWLFLATSAVLAAALFVFERRTAGALRRAVDSFQAAQASTAQRRASLAAALASAEAEKIAAREEEILACDTLTRLRGELDAWLAERSLPAGLPGSRALELSVELVAWQHRLRDLAAEEQILAADERLCAAACAEMDRAARSAGIVAQGPEEAATLLTAALDELASAREQKRRLGDQLTAKAAELARCQNQCAEIEKELAELLEQGACRTEGELRVRDRQAAAFRSLDADRRRRSLRIEATTGMPLAAAREGIRNRGGAEALRAGLEALTAQLAQLDLDKSALAESRGRCRAQLEDWEQDRRVAGLRAEEERLRARASDLAEKYALDRLALGLLTQAQRRFEEQQQPRILKLASRDFQELTSGRYVRVYAKASEPGALRVNAADGGDWAAEHLSRGTREQLYLAFRLAVIEDFGESRLPLPIVLDDVLVNFDRQRARNAVKVLARLSLRHQVVAFTCHEEVRDLFTDQGAHLIEVAREQLSLLAATA